jgi:glucose-6-phosphate 1-dehydrogenase
MGTMGSMETMSAGSTTGAPGAAQRHHPFLDDLKGPVRGAPVSLVIFGASGDLTQRKLVPAFYNLAADGLLDPATAVVGFARREKTDESFRAEMEEAVRRHSRQGFDPAVWQRLATGIHYVQGSFEDAGAYAELARKLEEIDGRLGIPGNRLYYLATPPAHYPEIVRHLGAAGGRAGAGFTRIIVEKPLGHDLGTARELNGVLSSAFAEDEIFRIDHYLGKETVQNILVFRLGNGIFEPLWNQRYVDHVQITVAETLGIEGRATYFETAGTARDMLQNHMLQLLTLVAMEPPVRFEADAVRDEKVKVIRSLKPPAGEEAGRSMVRAQYRAGAVGGEPVPGYLEEPGVAADSTTETYIALRLEIDNWRWAGTPFYLRAGKRFPKRATEIAIVFRKPPTSVFQRLGCGAIEPNVLALRIQPDEGISLSFGSKAPGQAIHIDPVRMDFLYETSFGSTPPEAYERLILDAIVGDATLFARRDEVELAWELVDRVRGAFGRGVPTMSAYAAGTWGPAEAEALIGRDGRRWRRL